MNDYMKALMDQFYEAPTENETSRLQQALGEQFTREQRKQLLRLIDEKNTYCENATLTSFIAGFRLAAGIAKELSDGRFDFDDAEEQRACQKWSDDS